MTSSAAANAEPTAMAQRPPARSTQWPTGMPKMSAQNRPMVKASVICVVVQPNSACIGVTNSENEWNSTPNVRIWPKANPKMMTLSLNLCGPGGESAFM